MPFDPTKPAFGSPDSSAEMRAQLNGLKDLIDAVPAGPQGPQGPPFASAVVDAVNTLNPGDSATVDASFDGTNVHLTFGLPRGNDGNQGPQGADGPQGPQGNDGPQGPVGEVSNAALATAIAGTAQNPTGITPFTGTFSDPPTQGEMQAFAAYVESLRAALVR